MAARHKYKVKIPGRFPTVLLMTEEKAQEYPGAVRLDGPETAPEGAKAPVEDDSTDVGGQDDTPDEGTKQAEKPHNKQAPTPQNKGSGE